MQKHLVVASKMIGLETNAEKTKNMAMYQDQNAGQNHCTQIEREEEFK
jgi:hypothetical protein